MGATRIAGFLGSVAFLTLAASPASADMVRIYQTNSGGDDVNVIDPATNKTVGYLKGVEAAHGVTGSPDGSRIYVSNESESTLDVFDANGDADEIEESNRFDDDPSQLPQALLRVLGDHEREQSREQEEDHAPVHERWPERPSHRPFRRDPHTEAGSRHDENPQQHRQFGDGKLEPRDRPRVQVERER